MDRPKKLIYFEVVQDAEDGGYAYGGESLPSAISNLLKEDNAHIEMTTTITEMVDLNNPCDTCKYGKDKTVLRCRECEYPWWKNHEPRDLYENTRWISVSERLPKDRDWYLGIFKEPYTGWINPIPFICDYVGIKTKATTNDYWILRGLTDSDDRIGDYYFNLECVAWMPLPEPYKAESEEWPEFLRRECFNKPVNTEEEEMAYCSDCIHRKVCGNEGVDDVSMTFCADKQTEDVVPVIYGRWIPVSERLPEEYVPVMISTHHSVFPEARYSKKYGWEWAYSSDQGDWRKFEEQRVIAWMPLPEPYKTESEE